MLSNKDEAHRRVINKKTDSKPSFGHRFNAAFCRKYIINSKVLDIGCWTGQIAQLLSPLAKHYIGIDPSEAAILYAQKNNQHAKFIVGTAEDMSFEKESFDTVVIFDVIEHVTPGSDMKVYKKINRVLKKNGKLILTTPSNNIFSVLLDPAYFLYGHRHYSVDALKESLQKSGFKIEVIIKTGTLISLITHNIELFYKHLFNKRIDLPEWVKKQLTASYESNGFAEIHLIASKVRSL